MYIRERDRNSELGRSPGWTHRHEQWPCLGRALTHFGRSLFFFFFLGAVLNEQPKRQVQAENQGTMIC